MTDQSDKSVNESSRDKVIADRYRIVAILGEGSMSTVYEVDDMQCGQRLALKTTRAGSDATLKKVKRLQREADATRMLDHPNIVRTYDSGIAGDGTPYLVMDKLRGRSLADLSHEEPHLPLSRCLSLIGQVCDALTHAHDLGVIHRDLKPSNIMIVHDGDDELAMVLDFGFAKFLPVHKGQPVLTKSGEVLGTLFYMSPEQSRGKQLDVRADIYSLGCVFYELLTGIPPYTGGTVAEIIDKQMNEKPLPICRFRADLQASSRLDQLVGKALSPNPAERFQTMDEFKKALNACSGSASGLMDKLSAVIRRKKSNSSPSAS